MNYINSKTWKRLDINLGDYGFATENVSFLILDHEYIGSDPSPDYDSSIFYSGFSPDGKLFAINEIISQKVSLYSIHQSNWFGWTEPVSKYYLYCTTEDWTEYSTASDWNEYQCICINMEYNWTYSYNEEYTPFLSDMYNDIIDYRQFLIVTGRHIDQGVDSRFEVLVDNEQLFSVPLNNDDFSHTYNAYLPEAVPYEGTDKTISIRIRSIDSEEGIVKNITMTTTCYRYVIYYLNKRGGWNWFFVNGKELKIDKMTRLSYKRNYFSQVPVDYNKVNYVNTINESWEFTTGWLEEGQAIHVIDLLESNRVYIQDLSANDNAQIPVLVTNSSVDYKTYKNQGRKLYSYTINVESSKPRYIIDHYKNIELLTE